MLAPIPELFKDAANFPKPELKDMADSYSRTVIEKPIPEKKSEVTEVRKLEAAIAKPKPAWWEIMQANFIGEREYTGGFEEVYGRYEQTPG